MLNVEKAHIIININKSHQIFPGMWNSLLEFCLGIKG